MRVLLISQYFPPDHTVGALRVQKVCTALLEAGHSVHVLTARNPSDHFAWREATHPRLRIECVRSLPTPRDAYLALKRHFSGEPDPFPSLKDGSSPEETRSATAPREGLSGYLARLTIALIRFPDVWAGFPLPAAITGWARHRAAPFDRIYTSSPPHSTHLAGWLLRRAIGVPWVAEMRDPWTDDPRRLGERRFRWLDAIDARLESACFRTADWIIALTDGAAALYRSRLPPPQRQKVVTIRSGIPDLRPPDGAPRAGAPRRIVYTGALYADRDPEPFLGALARVVQRRGLGPLDLRLRLVGHCRFFHGRPVSALVEAGGLERYTDFVEWGSPEEARAEQEGAALLLLWARNQPDQVPNKLYEYLGARVPIFGIVDREGETARLLRQVGGHTIIDSGDPEALAAALERALFGPREGTPPPDAESRLDQLSTGIQMQRLLRVIGAA